MRVFVSSAVIQGSNSFLAQYLSRASQTAVSHTTLLFVVALNRCLACVLKYERYLDGRLPGPIFNSLLRLWFRDSVSFLNNLSFSSRRKRFRLVHIKCIRSQSCESSWLNQVLPDFFFPAACKKESWKFTSCLEGIPKRKVFQQMCLWEARASSSSWVVRIEGCGGFG